MTLQLLLLAVAAMIGLAVLRLVRVHLGRTPLPEHSGRRAFQVAFVLVPPIVLGVVAGAVTGGSLLAGVFWIPAYAIILGALAILMTVMSGIAGLVAPRRARRLLLIALTGNTGDPHDVPPNPPVTARLARSMALVETANATFPRGLEFPDQVHRPDFHAAWDDLDAATAALEGQIAEDRRLGLGAAGDAVATAHDARSRLATLSRLAVSRGVVPAAT